MSIEGAKPRKWNKTINLNNPTMQEKQIKERHSHNILSIFDPEVSKLHDSMMKYYANKNYRQSLPKRAWQSTERNPRSDSLDQSKRKFNTIEHQRTEQKTPNTKERDTQTFDGKERTSKIWLSKSLKEPQIKSSYAYNPQLYLNYQNSRSIKNKQLHGYNIISNF